MGKELAHKLKAQVGDDVTVVVPLSNIDFDTWRAKSSAPRTRKFRVTGIFYSGFDEYDRRLMYTSLADTQELVGRGDQVMGVEMKVKDVDRAEEIADKLEDKLEGPPYQVQDWYELNHNLFTALELQKFVLVVILTLIIIVASVNMVSALTMMVTDKTREIAILKSMGATSTSLANVFQVVGLTIGGIGTLIRRRRGPRAVLRGRPLRLPPRSEGVSDRSASDRGAVVGGRAGRGDHDGDQRGRHAGAGLVGGVAPAGGRPAVRLMAIPRRRLRELTLTGWRRAARQGLLVILALAAMVSAVGFVLGLERARSLWDEPGAWGPWHSFAAESFGLPVVMPAVLAVVAQWARRGGLPRGVLVGLLALGEVMVMVGLLIAAHLFDDVDGTLPHDAAMLAQLAIAAAAAAVVVVEPLVLVLERRRLEADDPVVATARVVTRERS